MINPPYDTAITGIGVPMGDFEWWLYLDRWVADFTFSGQNQALWTKYMAGGTPLVNMNQTH
jgi:hypothetical protein